MWRDGDGESDLYLTDMNALKYRTKRKCMEHVALILVARLGLGSGGGIPDGLRPLCSKPSSFAIKNPYHTRDRTLSMDTGGIFGEITGITIARTEGDTVLPSPRNPVGPQECNRHKSECVIIRVHVSCHHFQSSPYVMVSHSHPHKITSSESSVYEI